MRSNTVKQLWRAGEPAFGAWLTIPSSISAETVAHAGFDYVCVDMQHGMIDYGDAVAMLTAISTTPSMPFVRVPWNDASIINRMLDAGAMGIIVPMVNSAEDARAVVSAGRYHPAGARSWGPIRAAVYAGDGYFPYANEEVALVGKERGGAAAGGGEVLELGHDFV
jgi:4-hydroxy-2-oxoheptanedioate aldolase